MKKLSVLLLIHAIVLMSHSVKGQKTKNDSIKNDSLIQGALKVYLDLSNCYSCGYSYVRKEINFVNYVRDLNEAQLYILILQAGTGSGGSEFTLIFNGEKEFNRINDTVRFVTDANSTGDETRIGIVKYLKMGLILYVLKTPMKDMIDIKYNSAEITNEKPVDKWKSWVFGLNFSTNANGEKTSKSSSLYSGASASKVTPDWKIRFGFSNSYSESKYIFDDWSIKTYSRSYYFGYNTVKSIDKHWSSGWFYSMSNSLYSNEKLLNNFYAGIEYDVFPYTESTSKLLTFRYKFGISNNIYADTTIFNKTKENLYLQSLGLSYNYITKWGSVSSYAYWSNYLYDFRKNNLYISTSFNVRVYKGLSVNAYASYSLIHDQLNLAKGKATRDEVLLRLKQLETQYSYYLSFGVSYTFGSIYNNVVNPRFEN